MTLLDIFYILRQSIIQLFMAIHVALFDVNSRHSNIFPDRFALLEDLLINVQ